jgi:hypothetical protein
LEKLENGPQLPARYNPVLAGTPYNFHYTASQRFHRAFPVLAMAFLLRTTAAVFDTFVAISRSLDDAVKNHRLSRKVKEWSLGGERGRASVAVSRCV